MVTPLSALPGKREERDREGKEGGREREGVNEGSAYMINGERAKRRTVQDNLFQLLAVLKITLRFLKKFL